MINKNELQINCKCHVVYSEKCQKIILDRISKHYSQEQINDVFEKIQHQYENYLSQYCRKDLGGKKNFHNGTGGTYDCIMLVCYYVICKEKTSFSEIEEMTKELTVGPYQKLSFVNLDKSICKRLMYFAFKNAEKKCAKWRDFEMHLAPYSADQPLHYCFTRCPFADFIHQFKLEEIAGALCNVDYASMDAMNIKLVRKHTCIESDHCDYTFFSSSDSSLKQHQEYVDELGFIRNK